jgi:DNA-binding CsgD family transcriptional regulator
MTKISDAAIIKLVVQGRRNRDIADVLVMTEHMVKNRLRNLFDQLGFHNRVELALWWIKNHENPVSARGSCGDSVMDADDRSEGDDSAGLAADRVRRKLHSPSPSLAHD